MKPLAHKKTTAKNDYVWTCDYCGQEFETKAKSDRHEMKCNKNLKGNREITIRLSMPSINNTLIFSLVGFGVYFLFFLLINSFAESNGLPSRDFLKPGQWFRSQPTPTVFVPTPTETPTPTLVPTIKPRAGLITNTTINNGSGVDCIGPDGKQFNTTMEECKKLNEAWGKTADYITNCRTPTECGGGSRRIKKSECDTSRCCILNSGNKLTTSEQECNKLQRNSGSSNSSESNSNQPKVAFTTKHAFSKGTFYCYEKAVNRLLNTFETDAQTYYDMYQAYCVAGLLSPDSENCKSINAKYEEDQKQLSDYIDQFCP